MIFIGDIHARFNHYKHIVELCESVGESTIQVGDLGFGFEGGWYGKYPEEGLPMNHRFIRGNHDEPDRHYNHSNYLGDYGLYYDNDNVSSYFFISGGISHDRHSRIEGVDWWRNEELDYSQLNAAIYMCEEKRPRVIVSHCAPASIARRIVEEKTAYRFTGCRTENALQVLFDRHQPDLWVFGHYHVEHIEIVGRTKFVCIPTYGMYSEKFGLYTPWNNGSFYNAKERLDELINPMKSYLRIGEEND